MRKAPSLLCILQRHHAGEPFESAQQGRVAQQRHPVGGHRHAHHRHHREPCGGSGQQVAAAQPSAPLQRQYGYGQRGGGGYEHGQVEHHRLRDLYYALAAHTTGSHVKVYNAPHFGSVYSNTMAEFMKDTSGRITGPDTE